ncbi:MAG: hypothetical protein J1E57_03490 [Prevotella sp.]|nr:hypothetical protein [Prevotella sp.]
MKKLFTFCAAALLSLGAFAQVVGTDENAVGIFRPMDMTNLEVGDCTVKEDFGVKITPIRGKNATYREETKETIDGAETPRSKDASDLYLGYSVKDKAEANQAGSAMYAADEVIFPFVAEQSARQEDEFFGFTMEIPEGTTVNIDALDVFLLLGNAYQWQVEITDAEGNVVYKTQDKGIKNNNYNKTAYTNGVHVTTTEVTEPWWSQEILESWSLAPNYDVTSTEPLPELNDLTGTYTVKVYYWGKWQKNLTYGNVYLYLSQDAAGISSAITDNAVENNVMYNLAGQRIAAPVSGQIYIQNGKKYIAE